MKITKFDSKNVFDLCDLLEINDSINTYRLLKRDNMNNYAEVINDIKYNKIEKFLINDEEDEYF